MSDQIPEHRDHDIKLISNSGILPTPAEIAEHEKAEQRRREENYKQLLFEFQAKQTTAQSLQASSNATIARLTRALVIVSLISGFVSWLQFIATKQSSDAAIQAVEIARDSRYDNLLSGGDTLIRMDAQNRKMEGILSQTKTALNASISQAKKALDTSINNSRLDLRPWVVLSKFQISQEPEADKPFTATVYVVNSGKTPALSVDPRSGLRTWYSASDPPPRDFALATGHPNAAMLSPGGVGDEHFTTDPLTLNAAQLAAYKSGSTRIYVQIRINYSDAFLRVPPHIGARCAFVGIPV